MRSSWVSPNPSDWGGEKASGLGNCGIYDLSPQTPYMGVSYEPYTAKRGRVSKSSKKKERWEHRRKTFPDDTFAFGC